MITIQNSYDIYRLPIQFEMFVFLFNCKTYLFQIVSKLYTGKTYTHNFHAITFSYENRMKIMRKSCEKVIHVYHAKKIYNFHVKIILIKTYYTFNAIIMRISCDYHANFEKLKKVYLNGY